MNKLPIESDRKTGLLLALEGMAWQFAHRGTKNGKSVMHTGGLSALEHAFRVLGWDDPRYFDDIDGAICDTWGCAEWVEAQGGMWAETGYWCLCRIHSDAFRKGKPQPKMKQRAIDREASRGEDGCLPFKQ